MLRQLKGRRKGRQTRALARAAGRRSGFELEVEAALNALLGREVEYEATRLEYVKRACYVPDFKDGEVLYEAKGRFLSADRTKLLAVRNAHPSIDLRLVFQRNNKLSKKSTTTYMDWATQHGFRASVYPDLPIGGLCSQHQSEGAPTGPSEGHPTAENKLVRGGGRKRLSSSTSKRPRT